MAWYCAGLFQVPAAAEFMSAATMPCSEDSNSQHFCSFFTHLHSFCFLPLTLCKLPVPGEFQILGICLDDSKNVPIGIGLLF